MSVRDIGRRAGLYHSSVFHHFPGGRVWMVDSRRVSTFPAADQNVHHDGILRKRTLNDGRTFEIVKVYYDPERLREIFEDAGFAVEVEETPAYFIYAVAER